MTEKSCPDHAHRGRGLGSRINLGLIVATIVAILAVVGGSITRSMAQDASLPAQAGPGGGPLPQSSGAGLTGAVPSPSTPAKPEEPPTEAERIIDSAIKKLAELKSVSATLDETVNMLNQKITIKGRYLKAPNTRIYLRLTVAGLPDTQGTTLQICDGETLWDYQRILDNDYYRKLSVKPILERLNSPELDPKLKEQFLTQMGFAGPETLLIGLRKTIRFDQKTQGTFQGKNVWILSGPWKPQSRQGLVGPDTRPVPQAGVLPPYIPSDAKLFLGADDGWPYQLILGGRPKSIVFDTRRRGPDGQLIGGKNAVERFDTTQIILVYSDVKINAPIRVEEFAFQAPPTATVDDATEIITRGLDQAIQLQAKQKKDEAATKDGPILEQPLDIPPPPATQKPQ